jgi:hypothetical protein
MNNIRLRYETSGAEWRRSSEENKRKIGYLLVCIVGNDNKRQRLLSFLRISSTKRWKRQRK